MNIPSPDIAGEQVRIQVCLSTSRGLISRLIRWITRSRASHALLAYYSATLAQTMVLQATEIGFHLWLWRKWRRHNRLVAAYELAVPADVQLAALRRLAGDLGAEYDTVSILHFLRRRWAKRRRNPLSSPRKLICSEAVAKFLKLCGLPGFGDPASFTPADLHQAMAAAPETFRLVEGRPPPRRLGKQISGQ